jgi:hypothetical protein
MLRSLAAGACRQSRRCWRRLRGVARLYPERGMPPDPVDRFCAAARAAGASTAIIAWQDEWDLTDAQGYARVRRARLLAYAGGEVVSADLPGDDHDREALSARLGAAGFTVAVRARNRS